MSKFIAADVDGNLFIDEKEFTKSMEDIPGLINFR